MFCDAQQSSTFATMFFSHLACVLQNNGLPLVQ